MTQFMIINRNYTTLVPLFTKPLEPRSRSTQVTQILTFCKSGSFFNALTLLNSTPPTQITSDVKPLVYASLLQTATKARLFDHGLQIHSHIVKSSLIANTLVGNSLLSLYFKVGRNLVQATKLFGELDYKDVISWTSMITGYVRVNPEKSLEYFRDMVLGVGIEANAFTLSAGIKACSEIGDVRVGRSLHGVVFRGGFESNFVIASSLVDLYGRNKSLMYARQVFDQLPEPDMVCWSSVISALTKNDEYQEALALFYRMQREVKLVPDEFTYGSVLTACGNLGRLKQGREVHASIIASGLGGNLVVESSLVDMYGKCGRVGKSRRVFDRMRKRNAVSWCALLNGYCQNGDFKSVIKIFKTMEDPDLYSFGTVIRACAGLAAVRQGKEVHCRYLRKGGRGYVIVESALVDLYAKCGCIDYAQAVFKNMPTRNMISWNSMICGLAQNGRGLEAVELFDQMVKEGIAPDYISFVGVIFACSHAGLVDQGREYFISMTEYYRIKPGTEHCNCMVDLLGRAGLVEEAESLIDNAECKDSFALWPTLLGACAVSRSSAAVLERIALKVMELEPRNHISYVYLINVYKSDGRWNDAENVRKLMEARGVEKSPGRSWVENVQFGNANMLDHKGNFPSKAAVG